MQSEANLTLEKAKTVAPQKEAIAEQSVQLRDGSKQSPILLGQVRGNHSSKPQSKRRDTAVRSDKQSTVKDAAPGSVGKLHCTRCGKSKHQKRDRCKKTQHATNVIKRAIIRVNVSPKLLQPLLVNSELSLNTAFVGSVSSKQQSSWNTTLQVREKEIRFKIDTGAEVTAISEETFRQLGGASLQRPRNVLYGPARHTLDVLGQFMTTLR